VLCIDWSRTIRLLIGMNESGRTGESSPALLPAVGRRAVTGPRIRP
jgi:hypothetical protein